MQLTVLGSSASYAGPGQACAGYLVEHGGTRIMLDCGNGALANLARVVDPLDLDAVFLTHAHADHFADIYSLQALLRYSPSGHAEQLPLYVPDGLFERLGSVLSAQGRRELDEAFLTSTLTHDTIIEVGSLIVRPMLVDHITPTFAVRVESDVATMCYTADTAYGAQVIAAARGCDLLLAEATLPNRYTGRAPHLTAAQASQVAVKADVRDLVLTHVWPTNDRDEMLTEACDVFAGSVRLAHELDTYIVGDAH